MERLESRCYTSVLRYAIVKVHWTFTFSAVQVAAGLVREPAQPCQTVFLLLPQSRRYLRPVHTIPQVVLPLPDSDIHLKAWQLLLWIKHGRKLRQSPFNNFCSMIESNRSYILIYFDGFPTNAIAGSTNVFNKLSAEGKFHRVCTMPRRENVRHEETNAKILIAAIKNRGSRALDFFLYRVANLLKLITSKYN